MTEMVERKKAPRYALELGLAVAGGWFAISTFLALTGSEPKGGMLTDPVMGLIAWIGGIPCLVLSLGFGVVGAGSFLTSRPVAIGPHCLGSLGTGVGLSILLGAFSGTLGGELGSTVVSSLPGNPGVVLGFLLGVSVIAGTVWLAWLPSWGGFYWKPSESGPVRAVSKKEAADGVSAAEAEALMTEVPGAETEPPSPFAISSPQADVRNRGGVPKGAHPIGEHAATASQGTSPVEPPDGMAAASNVPADEPAGADLAAAGPELGSAVAEVDEPVVEPASERTQEEVEPVAPVGSATAAEPIITSDASPIRPSWEQAESEPSSGIVQTAFVEPEPETTTEPSVPSSNGGSVATAEAMVDEQEEEEAEDHQAGLFEEATETPATSDVEEDDEEAEDEETEYAESDEDDEAEEEEYEDEEEEDELEEAAEDEPEEELKEVEVEPAPRAKTPKTIEANRGIDPIEEAAHRSKGLDS
ncbi:MAG: hypothetical protein O7B99_01945, partial [Planctomycetota bacterium]|nr:hypothetical protein [Planctomycetota bacterium]